MGLVVAKSPLSFEGGLFLLSAPPVTVRLRSDSLTRGNSSCRRAPTLWPLVAQGDRSCGARRFCSHYSSESMPSVGAFRRSDAPGQQVSSLLEDVA
mgnify:CR=1 FL=1